MVSQILTTTKEPIRKWWDFRKSMTSTKSAKILINAYRKISTSKMPTSLT